MAAVMMPFPLPADVLSETLLCDMPLFGQLAADLSHLNQDRLLFDVSPPESPSYSTTLSDTSGEEFLDSFASEFKLDYEAPEVMWSANSADFFMSSSVTWVPDSPSADDLGEFGSIVTFGMDDAIVAVEELPLAVTELSAAIKRKASDDDDARPAKKARIAPPVIPVFDVNSLARDDPEAKRHTHNVLERRRRNDLKNSYQQLRMQIPSLEDNERAPTGQILIHAVECITALKAEEQRIHAELIVARAENERLRALQD